MCVWIYISTFICLSPHTTLRCTHHLHRISHATRMEVTSHARGMNNAHIHILLRMYILCTPHTMRWLRSVGSLKLQVSFAEYRPFYKALLQKRPTILRSLLIVATPYSEYQVDNRPNKEKSNRQSPSHNLFN